jgi:hypothetical protein
MSNLIVRRVGFLAIMVTVSCVTGTALAQRDGARVVATGEGAPTSTISEALLEASQRGCSATLDVVASSSDDDAAACAAICSSHFRPGSAQHRECVECCYDPDCQ